MYDVTAIGEALIDFIPAQRDCALKEVESFTRVCGGAPTNVAAVVAKLQGNARLLTQVGNDAFGDYIVDTIQACGVKTDGVCRTDAANTALAFVSLKADGNRDFSFYRKPSADLLLQPKQIQPIWLEETGILHFCSVSLVESPMKETHKAVLKLAKKNHAIISFDPNIRLPLWPSAEACQETVREFLPDADLVKLSDEECFFVTGKHSILDAADWLFEQGCKMVLYSMGKEGAMILTPHFSSHAENPEVRVKDTTGAGDAIIGAYLYCLAKNHITVSQLADCLPEQVQEWLTFAVYYANYSITKSGAIASYPDYTTFVKWMQEKRKKAH